MQTPFQWDNYSDQAAILKDKSYKKAMRKKAFPSLAKTFFTALITLPISMALTPFVARKKIDANLNLLPSQDLV
jgi:hypothetical protein